MTAGSAEELRERTRALQESDPRYRLLFETSGDALLIVGRDGRIVEANQAACDLLGYERDELPGLEARLLAARPSQWDRFIQETEHQESVRDQQLACRSRTGRQMDCMLNGIAWRAADGNILGYQIDVRCRTGSCSASFIFGRGRVGGSRQFSSCRGCGRTD